MAAGENSDEDLVDDLIHSDNILAELANDCVAGIVQFFDSSNVINLTGFIRLEDRFLGSGS